MNATANRDFSALFLNNKYVVDAVIRSVQWDIQILNNFKQEAEVIYINYVGIIFTQILM